MVFKDFNLILPDGIEKGTIRVNRGVIRRIMNHEIRDSDEVREGSFLLFLSPGFIDIHIHGAAGSDTMDASFGSLNTISRFLCSHGITAFLPTTMAASIQDMRSALSAAKESWFKVDGAQILGIHLEGPFLSREGAGAQDARFFLPPSPASFTELTGDDEDFVRIVTLAPELEGAEELIRHLKKRGIHAAIGHTSATYAQTIKAIESGADHASHLFNAMPPVHQREPGAAGAVLDTEVTAELIADGIHVAYPVLRLAVKAKGSGRLILVSDAMSAAGMPDGSYELGGQSVFAQGGEARLSSGALAGSVLTLDQAVRNLYHNTTLPLHEVIRIASQNPASLCGAQKNKGRIADGADADLVIFDDDIDVKEVYIMGRRVR